ncbi:MAG: cation:proton antiporter [Anaerolineales bacterium]|nr:cation:proton antiporter [Anaerolineales bacterium]
MTPFLQFIFLLAVLIFAAKTGGYLSQRLGQPSVLGELLAGLLLGPTFLNLYGLPFLTDSHLPDSITHLAEVGVLLLLFIAGMELHLSDLVKAGKIASYVGVSGVLMPVLLGFFAARIVGTDTQTALFLGLMLAATSVSISAQTLMEMNKLQTRVGIIMLGGAVIDDILVLLGLSIFSALVLEGGAGLDQVVWILVRMLLYILVGGGLGLVLLPKLLQRVSRLPISEGLVAAGLIIAFLYAWAAEVLGGMAAITGSFLAGILISRSALRERIQRGISTAAYGFFVPIFFGNVGLQAEFSTFGSNQLLLLAGLSVIAVVSKLLGGGLGALAGGLSLREAVQVGVGMMARGEVILIAATIGINAGLIGNELFSSVVGVVLITTLLTPPILRLLYRENPAAV